MRHILFLAISAAAAPAVLAQAPAAPASTSANQAPAQFNRVSVELKATQGNRAAGTLELSPDNHGLRIAGTITGLKADAEHGFHVHENGDCSAADASSAGAHFNPGNVAHGNPTGEAHHAGDMANIKADAKGAASVDMHIKGLTLGDGGASDVLNKALIVHADPDDYTTDPAGNAGARIACGVISPPPPVEAAPAPAEEPADAE